MADHNSIKYPRILAKNETRDNRDLNIYAIEGIEESGETLNKRALTEFNRGYPYIFDGLSYICTWLANEYYLTRNGERRDLIGRKDDPTETHYRTILPIWAFLDDCCGERKQVRQKVLLEIIKLAQKEEKKILSLNDNYNILTAPVRIDLITKNGDTVTAAEKQNIKNLQQRFIVDKNDRYHQQTYTTREAPIAFIVLEYYKPLFEPILEKNSKGGIGRDYFQFPAFFQANLDATIRELVESNYFENTDLTREKVPITSINARQVFEVIADHDNGKGDHIIIPALEMARRCFPRYITRYTVKNGDVKESIPYSRGFEMRAKIKKAIIVFKKMGRTGEMDGGRLLPVELVESSVSYNKQTQEFKIRVIRPKNQAFPQYTKNEIDAYISSNF